MADPVAPPVDPEIQAAIDEMKKIMLAGQTLTPPGSNANQPNSQSDVSPLYLGYGTRPTPYFPAEGPLPTTVFAGRQWLMDLQANNYEQYQSVTNQLRAAGLLGPRSTSDSSVATAWEKALKLASRNDAGLGTGTDTGPAEVFAFLADRATDVAADPSMADPTAYTGPQSRTQITTPASARALIDNTIEQRLGRRATAQDRRDFVEWLNSTEAQNPTIDSPTGGGDPRYDRTTTGGVDAATMTDMAQTFAESRPDYAETQATTTLTGWAKEAIMSGPGLI